MRCPTCDRAVSKDQNVCSYCGGLVREIRSAVVEPPRGAADQPETSPVSRWEMHPAKPVEFPSHPNVGLPHQSPEEEPPPQAPTRRVPLIRVLVLVGFLLVPIFSVFMGTFRSFSISRARSVLREAAVCERVVDGEPINPKNIFSIKNDASLLVYTKWSPAREDSRVTFRWRSPEGFVTPSSNGVHIQAGRGEMIAVGRIGLERSMPTGLWHADVLLDGTVRATIAFEIGE